MSLKTHEVINEIQDRLCSTLGQAALLVEGTAKDNCPVDTGNLRASINTQLDRSEIAAYVSTNVEYANDAVIGYVSTNVEYAPYVEEGTSKMQGSHFLKTAIDYNRNDILGLFEGLI